MRERPCESILDLIGQTPLLHVSSLDTPGAGAVYAKLEFCNPGGSVKDRAALEMIRAAERAGDLSPGATIVEPTAGNTGIGLAMAGAALGYRVLLVVPARFSPEKLLLMESLGAEVILTPAEEGMRGAIARAGALASEMQNVFMPHQFENRANPAVHYRTTAVELWRQLDGRVDAVVIGAGTGGTFSGIARYAKERNPAVRAVLVESEGSVFGGGEPAPHRVEGIGNSFWPAVLDRRLIDEVITVTDVQAFDTVRDLARSEGLLLGGSSGANARAARQVAARLPAGARVATVFSDTMERYLSRGPAGDAEAPPSRVLAGLDELRAAPAPDLK